MKKIYLFKTLLLLFALVAGSGSSWADTVTFDATTDITDNAQSYQTTELTINAVDGSTWKAKGYGATANTNLVIGKGGANYLETPTVNGTITSVEVTWSGNTSYYLALQTTNGTELEAKSNPSASDTETFTVTGTYSQLRLVGRRSSGTNNAAATITKVVVNYTTGGGPSATPTSVSINDDNLTNTDVYTSTTAGSLIATVKDNDNNVISEATVSWESSDENVATIDDNGVVTLVAAGTTNITATYAGVENQYQSSSATYELEVTSSAPQPTKIEVALNNNFFGTQYTGSASGITDNNPIIGSQDNVTITYAGGGNHYINDSQIRFYPNNKLTFEAPEGYKITKIEFTPDGTWAATISADKGSYASNTKTWTGSESSVIFSGSGSSRCDMSKVTITLSLPSSIATPSFSPEGGTYNEAQNVTISCETEGVTIYYTTNGTTPSASNGTPGTSVTINETTTLKAIAVKDGESSEVASATYTIQLPIIINPIINPKEINSGYFVKVTNVNDLEDGDAILIVNDSYNAALSTTQNTNNRAETDVEFLSEGLIYAPSDDVQKLVLVKQDDLFYFYTGYGYLYAASSDSNYLRTENEENVDQNALAEITISNGDATITFQGDNTRNILRYNRVNESHIFSCYGATSSVQTPVQIYKEVAHNETAAVGIKGFATLVSNYALDFTGKRISAYTINSTDGSALTLTEKVQVAAGEPVLLFSKKASDSQDIPVIASTTPDSHNKLVAGTGEAITWTESTKYYVLNTADTPCFMKANASPVAKNKAYLDLTSVGASARSLSLDFGITTGISNVNVEATTNNRYFDLQGRNVSQPTKGLYIVNGKKVLVK